MTDFKNITHSQYRSSLKEAHRRPATPIGAPGLVWHMAIWPKPESTWPLDGCSRYPVQTPLLIQNRYNWRRWNWFKAADKFVQCFIKNAADSPEVSHVESANFRDATDRIISESDFKTFEEIDFPHFAKNPSGYELKSPPSPGSYMRMFRWRGHLTKIKLECYTEYITITFFIDLSKKPDSEVSVENLEKDLTGQNFKLLQTLLDEENSIINDKQKLQELKNLTSYLSDGVWNDFSDIFLKDCGIFLQKKMANYYSPHAFGLELGSEVFADARGVIILAGREGEIHRNRIKKAAKDGDLVASFSQEEQHLALSRLGPFIRQWSGGEAIARMLEFTCSTMFDDRAVVVTSMGNQFPYGISQTIAKQELEEVHERLGYIILLNGLNANLGCVNRWQVGRLVHRINSIGTLRLFALRDLEKIRKASLELMITGRYLDAISVRNISDTETARKTREDLNEVFKRLAKLSATVPYGLAYRIVHSHHAVSTLKTIMKDLRVQRIQGWQPYNEFLRRRLFSVFDSIEDMGGRLDQLRSRANSLLNQIHTAKLVDYQRAADILVYLAGTYYLANLIMYVFKGPLKVMGNIDLETHALGKALVVIASVAGVAAFKRIAR